MVDGDERIAQAVLDDDRPLAQAFGAGRRILSRPAGSPQKDARVNRAMTAATPAPA